jgi:substrate import-associated zinc metallohydrolase lipoprotein
MKRFNQFIYAAVALVILGAGCRKEDELNTNGLEQLGGDRWPSTEVDKWIQDTLTTPYNIAVTYRWNAFELDLDKTLVPPDIEKVVPMMRIVKKGWIDVYRDEISDNFIKLFCPKQYSLVGSVAYNTNGTVKLGEAESGRKVTLYRVNQLNTKDSVFVKRVLKTIQHEFVHILQQNVVPPVEYGTITPSGYTSDWAAVSDVNARAAGFITPYAMAEPREDMAEMIAIMLTEGEGGYEKIVTAQTATTQALFRKKEQAIVNYLKQNFNINLYSLRNRARLHLLQILN